MANTSEAPEIILPALEMRPWGRFLDVVPKINMVVRTQEFPGSGPSVAADRTAFGAKWMADPVLDPIVVDFSCDDEDEGPKTGNVTFDPQVTGAAQAHNLFNCTELSGDMSRFGPRIAELFRALLSDALARLATDPSISPDTMNLTDNSTALAAPTDPTDAIGLIEDALGERISNYRGHIFVPLRHLAYAMADGAVFLRDGQLTSSAGHLVIADAGHVGDDTFFGTGSIGWSATDPQMLSGIDGELDRVRNIREWIAENWLLVAFNENHSVRTTLA